MQRRTKIVTTLGPATDDPNVLAAMIRAGADVVRLNFSHGRPEEHKRRMELARAAATSADRYVGVLGDLRLRGADIRIERATRAPALGAGIVGGRAQEILGGIHDVGEAAPQCGVQA